MVFRGRPDSAKLRELGDQAMKVLEDDGQALCIRSDWRERVKAIRPEVLDLQARRHHARRVAAGLCAPMGRRIRGFRPFPRRPGRASPLCAGADGFHCGVFVQFVPHHAVDLADHPDGNHVRVVVCRGPVPDRDARALRHFLQDQGNRKRTVRRTITRHLKDGGKTHLPPFSGLEAGATAPKFCAARAASKVNATAMPALRRKGRRCRWV